MAKAEDMILVHGALGAGSSWSKVISILGVVRHVPD